MKTAIVTDSNSGIFETEGIRLGVHVLPMPVLIDNQVYFEGQNLSSKQFYQYPLRMTDEINAQFGFERAFGKTNDNADADTKITKFGISFNSDGTTTFFLTG